ncbi:MAG: AsmA family protein [Bacteroidales bacterium]|nr:AsmA family protein [Bacteroidales bacterium]
MKKHIKRGFLGMGILVAAIVVAAIVIAAFFQEAVGKKLIAVLIQQLKTEVKVRSFDLSLLRNFPDATASLKDVTVMGLNKKPLLEAQELAFNFRLLSLFEQQVKIHSVTISNGALDVWVDKNGKNNYDIFKPSKSDAGDDQFNISLEKATLKQIGLS